MSWMRYLRVPVAVVDDTRVGGREGNAHTACLRRQQHHEHVAAAVLEVVDRLYLQHKRSVFQRDKEGRGGVGSGSVGLEGYFLCTGVSQEWSGKKTIQ